MNTASGSRLGRARARKTKKSQRVRRTSGHAAPGPAWPRRRRGAGRSIVASFRSLTGSSQPGAGGWAGIPQLSLHHMASGQNPARDTSRALLSKASLPVNAVLHEVLHNACLDQRPSGRDSSNRWRVAGRGRARGSTMEPWDCDYGRAGPEGRPCRQDRRRLAERGDGGAATAGTVGSVDVRGGGPGTHETDALDPTTLTRTVDAVVLTGGAPSAWPRPTAPSAGARRTAAASGPRRGGPDRAGRRDLRPRPGRGLRRPPGRGDGLRGAPRPPPRSRKGTTSNAAT